MIIGIFGILVVATLICFILTWSIGANDVANTFGTSVGAKVLTTTQACLIAAIFEFLGAFLMGSHVADTFRQGILHVENWDADPAELAVGLTAAMIGGFVLVTLATYFSLPVSGTHAIIGAVIGFAVVSRGVHSVKWSGLGYIAIGWVASPVCAGICSLLIFLSTRFFILRANNSFERGIRFLPILYGVTVGLVAAFIVYKGSPGVDLSVIPWWGVLLFVTTLGVAVAIVVLICQPLIIHWANKKAGYPHEFYSSNPIFKICFRNQSGPSKSTIIELREIEVEVNPAQNPPPTNENEGTVEVEMEKHEELQTEASEVQGTVPEGKIENGEDKVTQNEENRNLESEQTGNQTENKGEEGKEEKKEKTSEVFDSRTEQLFSAGQVLMAIVGSFAHGANDIANAIGPYAVILSIYQTKEIGAGGVIPWWVLVMGGVGIVTGLATWGYKVIKTIGENLTKVTPARGFNIELGSAFVVLTASRIGIPLSTTHCKVGAVVGVGLADGGGAVKWKMVLNVAAGWLVTLPIAAIVSALAFALAWYPFEYSL